MSCIGVGHADATGALKQKAGRCAATPRFLFSEARPREPKALTFISRTIRRWTLHHSSDKSLPNLAEMYNPCIRGWINYYSNFYRTQLRSTLKRIDLYVIRWSA